MVETRYAARIRVSKGAKIYFGASSIDCTISNLSSSGAALKVSNQIEIPDKFTLAVPADGLLLSCDVVWRKQYRIGVAFS
jgi:PilZ domain